MLEVDPIVLGLLALPLTHHGSGPTRSDEDADEEGDDDDDDSVMETFRVVSGR